MVCSEPLQNSSALEIRFKHHISWLVIWPMVYGSLALIAESVSLVMQIQFQMTGERRNKVRTNSDQSEDPDGTIIWATIGVKPPK